MSIDKTPTTRWPELPFAAWRETAEALHLYAQIVGKYRLARTPWVNHSWHATLYVNARGLTTGLVPDAAGGIEVTFDLHRHRLLAEASDGRQAEFALRPMTVAEFHARFTESITQLGGDPDFHGRPNEVPDPIPFHADRRARPYDADAVQRFHAAQVLIGQVLLQFRTGFVGKVSPVHLFWGSFDLAVTRFSGRCAPPHPGGLPALPDDVTREAYSHEVSSAGFWPGGGPFDDAAFYSYAYPTPSGFDQARVSPAEAWYDAGAGEFILPYRVVQRAADPSAMLLAFLQSTYQAAADLAGWDQAALQCAPGQRRVPRTN